MGHNINNTYSAAYRFTVFFSVMAALILPVGFFSISYQYLMGIMETSAEINSELVSRLISANPDLWRYETIRIEELLSRRSRADSAETRRIYDMNDALVAESVNDLPIPVVSVFREIVVHGEPAGRIEISRSMAPLLGKSGLLAIVGLGFGLLLYRWLPFASLITAGNQLRDTNEFLSKVMEGSSNSLLVLDQVGNVKMINGHFQILSALPRTEIIGFPLSSMFSGAALQQVDCGLNDVASGRAKNFRIEAVLIRRDGKELCLTIGAEPLTSDGVVSGVVVAFDDITERKKIEVELQKKNIEMEQFIYTVSHDLRSPLVTVKTFLGYLESDLSGTRGDRVAQDLQFIHGAADKMKLLLDELLEISRVDHIGNPHVRVSFNEVVAGALATLAGDISSRKVEVVLSDSDLMLFGDVPRLSQIWQNLIENAIKYGSDDDQPCIELGVEGEGVETVFYVRDNGMGIEPQYVARIFNIFEKLDASSPGAGMGLAMVRRIVQKFGGRVWVESEGSGKGACFYFTLPYAVDQSMPVS